MTFCLFQIQSYKTKRWVAFLWLYVMLGAIVAIPLAFGQFALESWRKLRRRCSDASAL